MIDTTIHRLEEIRKAKGLSFSELEKSIGFSIKGFSSALKDGRSVKDEIIRNTVKAFPDVSLRWLVTGQGEMYGIDDFSIKGCTEYLTDNLEEALKEKEFVRLLDYASTRKELLEMKKEIESIKKSQTIVDS